LGREYTLQKVRFDKREEDLKFFLLVGKQLLRIDDLHYGLWPDDLEVTFANLGQAQENHSQLMISNIPEGTRSILDVGCGAGALAKRLVGLGYEVEGVTPSAVLAAEGRKLLDNNLRIFESRIEDLEIERQYDVVLFSESFQYVEMEKALAKCLALLNPGGHLLICDFFRKDVEGDSPFNSGPRLSRFREIVSELPLDLLEDIDITSESAPTMDLADDVLRNFFSPALDLVFHNLSGHFPRLGRFVTWRLQKWKAKVKWRYFNGAQSGANFEKHKSYRLMLFKKTGSI